MAYDMKVEANEIKTEPCDLSSEESESHYVQNTTSEEEDASSDKRRRYRLLNGERMLLHIYENQFKNLTGRNEPNLKEVDKSLDLSSNVDQCNNNSSDQHIVLPDVTKSGTISGGLRINTRKVHVVPISNASKNIKIKVLSLTKNEINAVMGNSDTNSTETDSLENNICNLKRTIVRSSRKRKLHEISDPLSDEEEEKRRIGAINAKKNREVKKLQFDQLSQELLIEKNANDNLKMQIKGLCDEKKIAVLEKENAELKYQILLDKYTRLLKLHNSCVKHT